MTGKRHRIHLSGPMTGLPNRNAEAFAYAEKLLLAQGHTVFNPTVITSGSEYRTALMQNLVFICEAATAQVLIPGHECSPGSLAAAAAARAIGLLQYVQRDDEFWLLDETRTQPMKLGAAPKLTVVGDN